MIATIVSGGLKAVVWGLAVVGLAGLVLAGLIASPVRQPPELTAHRLIRTVDLPIAWAAQKQLLGIP